MSTILPVTTNQTDSVAKMANEKKVGRESFQKALEDGSISNFLDSLLLVGQPETEKKSILTHLYEFRVCKDGADATTLIGRTRPIFFVSEYAETMANKDEFVAGPKENAVIRVFAAEGLDVTGWSETDFFGPNGFKHVKRLGLLPCLSDDAFYIRAAHPDQKLNEWIRVLHKPISASRYSSVFNVGRLQGRGRCVDGYDLDSYYRLGPGSLVAVRVAS